MRQRAGAAGETFALQFLRKRGLRLLARNYRCRMGEIDLIMHDGEVLVFVEVRYRRSSDYGGALGSVDRRKQARIVRTAMHYVAGARGPDDQPMRFDVVALSGDPASPQVDWRAAAFEPALG